jgi:hypothetical protein
MRMQGPVTGLQNSESPMIMPLPVDFKHLADQINKQYDAVKMASKQTLIEAMALGDMILQVYAKIGHTDRGKWLRKYCPQISMRSAQIYIKLAMGRSAIEKAMIEDQTLSQRDALKLITKRTENAALRFPDIAVDKPTASKPVVESVLPRPVEKPVPDEISRLIDHPSVLDLYPELRI